MVNIVPQDERSFNMRYRRSRRSYGSRRVSYRRRGRAAKVRRTRSIRIGYRM